ncbi:demethylmenaquinone methyltransferase [Amycolatopsis sulphurea]|uniref:Putative 4-hydroxy-4-methyl-2-oxoglutarate aldolase n=1 Tax=Amycolatopsis sulphurea TaxID=76022 RepID=A0A2A9G2E6_9PSEU|nr:RraA family protein [Amycolatopsis sulphurea]PFG56905.1 demethylmenaquinone methyltransferase [Amycolatopsis sulphurea]
MPALPPRDGRTGTTTRRHHPGAGATSRCSPIRATTQSEVRTGHGRPRYPERHEPTPRTAPAPLEPPQAPHGRHGSTTNAEVRDLGFPVFARGVIPIPGAKAAATALGEPVHCAGVTVSPGDVVVADEEGVVVVPAAGSDQVLADALAKLAKEAAQTLGQWEADHRVRIDAALRAAGFTG